MPARRVALNHSDRVSGLVLEALPELSNLTVPTLLIWGDADQLITHDAQRLLLEVVPAPV